MSPVSIGQVWRDKDKRRDRTIEIIEGPWREVQGDEEWDAVRALVVGTERETTLKTERLTSRWELVLTKPQVSVPAPKNWQLKAVCARNIDYKVRLSQKIASTYGMPVCPCHLEPMVFTESRG